MQISDKNKRILFSSMAWIICLFVIRTYLWFFNDKFDNFDWLWWDPSIWIIFSIVAFYITHFFIRSWLSRIKLKLFFKYLLFFLSWMLIFNVTFGTYTELISQRTGGLDFMDVLYMVLMIYLYLLMPILIIYFPIYSLVLITGLVILFYNKQRFAGEKIKKEQPNKLLQKFSINKRIKRILCSCIAWYICWFIINYYVWRFNDWLFNAWNYIQRDCIFHANLFVFGIVTFCITHYFIITRLKRIKLKLFKKYLFFFILWLIIINVTLGVYLKFFSPKTVVPVVPVTEERAKDIGQISVKTTDFALPGTNICVNGKGV